MSHPPGPYQGPPHGPRGSWPPQGPPGPYQGPPQGYGPPPLHGSPGYGPPHGGPAPQPEKRAGFGLIALIGCGAVLLLLIVVGVGGFLWFRAGGGDDSGGGTAGSGSQDRFEYPEEFEGAWSGRMSQYAPDGAFASDWTLSITLEPGSRTGTARIATDSGNCTLDYTINSARENLLNISYTVTEGVQYCVETGDMTLRKSGSAITLNAEVKTEWPDGTSTSNGILSRD